ncbi:MULTISPECIES: hypothetical protein [Pseudomonas]|uniref:hypothetical protein n=1 Tax=Pseudomonas TaxID=286 RepID=UPI0009BB3E7E|nr:MULTISPECIES: hypothetical protein [Pseudomonas]QEO78476.1 hypothetical protein ELZ14_13230 [Pseudomonas brassicacearum]WHS56771.1 hypothetical protein QLH64_12545 [Pseudomonas brassicacearum]
MDIRLTETEDQPLLRKVQLTALLNTPTAFGASFYAAKADDRTGKVLRKIWGPNRPARAIPLNPHRQPAAKNNFLRSLTRENDRSTLATWKSK